MSRKAVSWAWDADLPLCAKMILLVYADHAGEDGQGVWATTRTLKRAVTQTSDATVSKHVGILLAGGYIREGDQGRISPYWKGKPPRSRPVVYDLAMNDETRLRWAAGYDPASGRRGAAVAAGREGGTRSAAARRPAGTQAAEGKETGPTPGSGTSTQGVGQETRPGVVKKLDPRTKSCEPVGGNPPVVPPAAEPAASHVAGLRGGTAAATGVPAPDRGAETPADGGGTADDQGALAREVLAVRGEWTRAGVERALAHPVTRSYPPGLVREVMLALARDPQTVAPGRLPAVLPHWHRPGSTPAQPKPSRPAPVPLPDGWEPAGALLRWAAATHPGLDVDSETARFRFHHQARASRRQNWAAEWQKWITSAAGFAARRDRPGAFRPSAADRRMAEIDDLERRMFGSPPASPRGDVPAGAIVTVPPDWVTDTAGDPPENHHEQDSP